MITIILVRFLGNLLNELSISEKEKLLMFLNKEHGFFKWDEHSSCIFFNKINENKVNECFPKDNTMTISYTSWITNYFDGVIKFNNVNIDICDCIYKIKKDSDNKELDDIILYSKDIYKETNDILNDYAKKIIKDEITMLQYDLKNIEEHPYDFYKNVKEA